MPLIKIISNFPEVSRYPIYGYAHTYMSTLVIYALQKLWSTYYYSSTYSFSNFTLRENLMTDPAHFEPFLLDCFSTSKLKIISSGSEGDRNDKVEFIADNPLPQKYLNVCFHNITNCGVCEKCLRTLFALDTLNKLDNFREVFDIDEYLKNRDKHYTYLHNIMVNQSTYKIAVENQYDAFLGRSYRILSERHKDFF